MDKTKLAEVNLRTVLHFKNLFSNQINIPQFHTYMLSIGNNTPANIWLRNTEPFNTFLAYSRIQGDQELLRIQLGISLNDDDFVFIRPDGSPINPNAVTLAFKRIIKRAGLKDLRIHDLRHTHATLMLKAGIHPKVVSERLGHANIGITLDIYSHVLPGMQEAAAEKFDMVFEVENSQNSDPNVSKMLANGEGVERRPYRSRTCDTLIKSQGVSIQTRKEVKTVFSTP